MHTDEKAGRTVYMADHELSAGIKILRSIMDATEEEFLMLGNRTGSFSMRSEKIVTDASAVVSLISNDTISQTIARLNGLMERVSRYIARSETEIQDDIRILHEILGVINTMLGPLGKLQGITKKLRALGMSTMIQNAALRGSSEGFRILGEDIRNLSEVISTHTLTIISEIQALNSTIRTSISRLEALFDSQRQKASSVLRHTMAGIKSLNEKYRLSVHAAQDISVHFDHVTRSIRQIVTMLQFHDITRQQFGAVTTSFSKMIEQLHPGPVRSNRVPYEEKQFVNLVREIIHFCRTQGVRIRQVRQEFMSAVEDVQRNLSWIASNIDGLVRKAGHFALPRENSVDSSLADIEASLTTVSSTLSVLSENALVRKELSDSISPVVNITGEIAAAMQEIRHIGKEIQFISYNSAIKSNHIGREGRGLGVISDYIQVISSDTQELTGDIGGMLAKISGCVHELTKHLESHILTQDDVVQGMSVELKQLIGILHEVNMSVGSSLKDIDREGMVLSRDISAVAGGITSAAAVDAAAGDILDHLDTVQKRFEQYLQDGGALLYESVLSEEHPAVEDRAMRRAGELGGNVELF